MARSEINFFGFSFINVILFLLLTFAIPYNSGFETLCKRTFAPFESLQHSPSILVKFCP